MYCPTNLLFDIPLIYYYTNLISSITYCIFSGFYDLFSFVFKHRSFEDFEILVILSAVLLPIKSPVASEVFWIALFGAVFIAFVVNFLALSSICFGYTYC